MFVHTIKTDDLPGYANARNWPGLIKIRPNLSAFAAVWAQEAYEATWKLSPINMLRFMFSEKARIQLEIIGHEIETRVASALYLYDQNEYRKSEATAMKTYSIFRRYTVQDIEKAMIRRGFDAQQWIDRHRSEIMAQQ